MEEKEFEEEKNENINEEEKNENKNEEEKKEINSEKIINNNNEDFFSKIKLIKEKHKEHNDEFKNNHFSLLDYKMDKVLGDEKLKNIFELLEPNSNKYPSVNFQTKKRNNNEIQNLFPKTNFSNIKISNNKTLSQLNSLYKDITLLNQRNKSTKNSLKRFEEFEKNLNENITKKLNRDQSNKKKKERDFENNTFNNSNNNLLLKSTKKENNTFKHNNQIGSFLNLNIPSFNSKIYSHRENTKSYLNEIPFSKIDLKYNKNYFNTELTKLYSSLDKACDHPIKNKKKNKFNSNNTYKKNIGMMSQYYNTISSKLKNW